MEIRSSRLVVAVLVITVAGSGCGFVFHSPQPRRADASLDETKCRQSNLASGFDTVGAATGFLMLGIATDTATKDQEVAVAGAVVGAVLTTTAIYGFVQSRRCRHARERAGLPTHGGNHWVYPWIGVLSLGAGAGAVSGFSGATGQSGASSESATPTGSCGPGDTVTAICKDGSESCSTVRQGTCSSHGGVHTWI